MVDDASLSRGGRPGRLRRNSGFFEVLGSTTRMREADDRGRNVALFGRQDPGAPVGHVVVTLRGACIFACCTHGLRLRSAQF
jgi:hypothetical protein